MAHHDDDGCPECGAPLAIGTTRACVHCGYRIRPPLPPVDDEGPVEAGDLAADALTAGRLQAWYHRNPPGTGQDAHPDAGDVPFARAV